MANQDPRRHPARTSALTGLIGEVGGGRRAFVDATGTSVVLPPTVRRLVATDDRIGALLLGLGAPVVGCAGEIDGVESVGPARGPDPAAVAALRPDVIVAGAVDRTHDLVDARLVEALRRVAPVVAVHSDRPAAAAADLRALLATVPVERPEPAPRRRPERPPVRPVPPGPPSARPELW